MNAGGGRPQRQGARRERRKLWLAVPAALVTALFAAALITPTRPRLTAVEALADPGATVADFMQVVHGPNGLRIQVQEALRGSGPADDKAWKAVRARAVIIGLLTTAILERAEPKKGTPDSWKAQVNKYQEVARGLITATGAKNRRASLERVAVLARSCKSCHKAHK